jgi:hypothetical protein
MVSGARSDGASLGSAYPAGITTITWTASDASGNAASALQTVTVQVVALPPVDPQARINDLIAYVLSLQLSNGTTNPLVNQLRSALRVGDGYQGCQKLEDFSEAVASRGSQITAGQTLYMIGQAIGIMEDMGCPQAALASVQRNANNSRDRTTSGRENKVNGRDKQSPKR